LTLNRPDARNALDLVMRGELLSALDEVEADPQARVVILTGAGGHFCAGGDVKTMRTKRQTAADGRRRVESLNRMVQRLVEFPRPTIAEAHRIGLVNRVVKAADLAAETQALAERIATGPPLALRLAKQMVNRAATSDLASALDAEAGAQAIAITSEDHQEGLAAFFEKRAPRF